ncbi:DUF4097 family beta strand repeat protein [Streptococcus uberis]|uniref:DUF4097 family beta strand repeat-containing protein n=1 Tax=Streptococcus uberis TaxID=1349 RepID=UPI000DA385D4|nr:DUF4097 family beta strand repeat-containing protein [Streptococcus uberis]MTB58406.1 DUF4097 family beta strand repeat protein [Streptococcus uberis]MTB62899.1 DUF4097 family beta strand repeat protein [Streptococcus uberis]MTB92234.1 DUF4097 family beta strand repeat protein [Streptococcus uberis]MTC00996.1 DUF4097 family beta strand repeat protein [Streptococcus uberis]MTC88212.1 DUF4097 family beta strand repeat protein [Streptococcus uberis]
MKTWKKTILITSLCLLISGAALAGFGFIRGGWSALSHSKEEPKHHTYKTQELKSFENISLNCNVSDITIKTGNQDKGAISYFVDKSYPIKINQKDKTLSITETSKLLQNKTTIRFLTLRNLINIDKIGHFGLDSGYSIQITLPKGSKIQSLNGKLKVGELQIEKSHIQTADFQLSAGNLSVSSSELMDSHLILQAGDMTFIDSHISKSKLKVNAGNVEVGSSKISDSQVNLSAGDFTASDVAFVNKNRLSLSMGDADIQLKDHNLAIKTNKEIGDSDITSNLKTDSQNQLELTSKLGDITIE